MKKYKNLSGDSGVDYFDSLATSIKILFINSNCIYTYNYSKPGKLHVEKMKILAEKGKGLATYISQNVKKNYAHKTC